MDGRLTFVCEMTLCSLCTRVISIRLDGRRVGGCGGRSPLAEIMNVEMCL